MSQTPRERVAERQALILRALLEDGPLPPGLTPERAAAARAVLARKRAAHGGAGAGEGANPGPLHRGLRLLARCFR